MSRTPTCLLAVVVAVVASQGRTDAQLELSGYGQFRYSRWDAALAGTREFDMRRLFLAGCMPIGHSGTTATLELDFAALDVPGGKLELSTATIRHVFDPLWTAQVGLADAWFGYEVDYSSRKRLPLERSRAAGQFLPGCLMLGVGVRRSSPTTRPPEFAVALSNGMHNWRYADTRSRAVLARVRMPLGNDGVAGISYMAAERTQPALGGGERDFDDDCLNLHLRWNGSGLVAFQAEYYRGEILGVSADGWYGMLEYRPRGTRAAVFYRCDTFGMAATSFHRHTVGCAYDLDADRRLTAQLEDYEDNGLDATNFALQYQFRYATP